MKAHGRSALRADFEAAFVFPFNGHAWQSERGRERWADLEVVQDSLAGPLHSIVESGGCAYVYAREDEFFSGVDGPAALHARLGKWHGELMARLDEFAPTSAAEAADLEAMRQFATAMWMVTERAIEVERTRWKTGRADR